MGSFWMLSMTLLAYEHIKTSSDAFRAHVHARKCRDMGSVYLSEPTRFRHVMDYLRRYRFTANPSVNAGKLNRKCYEEYLNKHRTMFDSLKVAFRLTLYIVDWGTIDLGRRHFCELAGTCQNHTKSQMQEQSVVFWFDFACRFSYCCIVIYQCYIIRFLTAGKQVISYQFYFNVVST